MKRFFALLQVLLLSGLLCGCIGAGAAKTDANELVGSWADRVSLRATMTVASTDSADAYELVVSWSDSAFVTTVWTFECDYDSEKAVFICDKRGTRVTEVSEGETSRWADLDHLSATFRYFEGCITVSSEDPTLNSCVFERFVK